MLAGEQAQADARAAWLALKAQSLELLKSGWEDVPREPDGKWTSGGSGSSEGGTADKPKPADKPARVANRDEVVAATYAAVDKLKFDRSRLIISDKSEYIKVGKKSLEKGADFNPKTGKITVFTRGIEPDEIPGMLAHETQHVKWAEVDSNELIRSEFFSYLYGNKGVLKQLAATGGVTDYDQLYWKAAKGDPQKQYDALDESLAEVARLKYESPTKYKALPKIWRQTYLKLQKLHGLVSS
jgi:hypothetical protein